VSLRESFLSLLAGDLDLNDTRELAASGFARSQPPGGMAVERSKGGSSEPSFRIRERNNRA